MEKTRTPTMKTTTKGPSLKLEDDNSKMKSSSCKVKFVGWRTSSFKDWESWVQKMCSLHKSTWENAGIYEAIMSSNYTIKRQDNLILELGSRWCSKTNTFVFPWGNATLTLGDISILGGYSVSGVSVLTSIDNDAKTNQIKERLELARVEIIRTKSKAAPHGKWMEKFIGSERDLEHAAFLSLWLSRHVCLIRSHHASRNINKKVFPVAALLSRGIKVALAPVVLAMLYRELSLLSDNIRYVQHVDHVELTNLYAQFHLLQVWAWERFPALKPVQNSIGVGDEFPRLARWSNVKIEKEKDFGRALDTAGKSFLWCPYGDSAKQEARNLMSFDLVGFDFCIEKYQPQLVARQFGLDSGVKGMNSVDCPHPPPGFTHQVEVINVLDSDSSSGSDSGDHDCSASVTEVLNLPILRTGSSTFASPDLAAKDACFMDKSEASKSLKIPYDVDMDDVDMDNEDELVEQLTNVVSPHSNNESNGAVEVGIRSEHETREDGGQVADNRDDDIQVMEGRSNGLLGAQSSDFQNDLVMSCDAESFTDERSKDSVFDLEARICRLEDIAHAVNARIKVLQAAKFSSSSEGTRRVCSEVPF